MKRIINLVTAISLTFAMITAPVKAQSDIKITVDGSPVYFDVAPQIIDGRTMVPIRAIFETIGATVMWNDESKTAVCAKGGTSVRMSVNSSTEYVNGSPVKMDCAPTIIDGRILAPARFAAEAFGYDVSWNDAEKTVIIEKTDESYCLNAFLGYDSSQDKFAVFISFQNEDGDYVKLNGTANVNIVNENGEVIFGKEYEFDESMFFTNNDSLLCEFGIPGSEMVGDRLGTGTFMIDVSTDDLYWDTVERTSDLHGKLSNQSIDDRSEEDVDDSTYYVYDGTNVPAYSYVVGVESYGYADGRHYNEYTPNGMREYAEFLSKHRWTKYPYDDSDIICYYNDKYIVYVSKYPLKLKGEWIDTIAVSIDQR